MDYLLILTLLVMLLAGIWAVTTRQLIHAALGLAAVSVLLAIVLYELGAKIAAIFELSVCAGLITVVFVSTISLTKRETTEADYKAPTLQFKALLTVLLVVALATISALSTLTPDSVGLTSANTASAGEVLWGPRRADMLGQIIIVLAGVFGVVVLFKQSKKMGADRESN